MARAMKDSGVPWIGEIEHEFQVCRLKYLLSEPLMYGANDSGIPYNISLPRYIRITDITMDGKLKESGKLSLSEETAKGFILKDGDILFARSGATVGKAFLYKEQDGLSAFAGYLIRARVREGISPEYLFYYTQSSAYDEWKKQIFIQSTIQNIGADRYNQLPVTIPDLKNQRRIVSFLNTQCARIDAVIEKTRASIEEYKKLKQSVITEAVTKGIRPGRKMKDSGIEWVGKIPEDWESVNPKALFSQRKEKALVGERQLTASQQYGVVYQDEYMELTGSKVVTVEKDFDILKHVESGDFVISMRSFQGGLEYSTKTGSISSAYVMLIPNLSMVFPRFYRWLLKSSVYINALQSTSNMVRDGQAMRYSNFAQVRLYSMPLDEQEEIANYLDEKCDALDQLVKQKESFLAELESYKKSLIFEYVTGKKEVIQWREKS